MTTASRTLLGALTCFAVPAMAMAQTAPANPQTAPTAPLPDAPSAVAQIPAAPAPTGPTVLLETSMGRLTCQLFDQEAPLTSANFVGLATGTKPFTDPSTRQQVTGRPFYNGTQFHRVIPGFMIQGGDPLANGTGDSGFYIPNETSPALRFDVAGRLAMANSGPNTNSSQFFITEQPYSTLNGSYTIFGQCDPASVAVVTAITHVQRDYNDKPLTPVLLNKVTVIPVGQPVPPAPATAPGTVPSSALPATPATTRPTPPQP